MFENRHITYGNREEEYSPRDMKGKDQKRVMAEVQEKGGNRSTPEAQCWGLGRCCLHWEGWIQEQAALNAWPSGHQRTTEWEISTGKSNSRLEGKHPRRGRKRRDGSHNGRSKSDHHDNSNLLKKVRKAEGEWAKWIQGRKDTTDTIQEGKKRSAEDKHPRS